MKNIIIILILLGIIFAASWYVYKSKKGGRKCIGCPHSDSCPRNCHCDR